MATSRKLKTPAQDRPERSLPETSVDIRVLVIEDDDDLRDTLCRYLGAIGMTVHGVPSAEGLDEQLSKHPVDLVVCDVNLPGENGFSIIARLRLATKAGVIMLTARGLEEDRLLGLSLGADCYLVKPVNLRELEFVIRNLHRRVTEMPPTPEPAQQQTWLFNAALWTITAPNGQVAQLSMAESRCLGCLIARAGEVVTREELLQALGRPNLEAYSRNLDVTISRLRKKVESLCEMKLPVASARGMGYAFNGRGEAV